MNNPTSKPVPDSELQRAVDEVEFSLKFGTLISPKSLEVLASAARQLAEKEAHAEKAEKACASLKHFLSALRLSHDLDVEEQVWEEIRDGTIGQNYIHKDKLDAQSTALKACVEALEQIIYGEYFSEACLEHEMITKSLTSARAALEGKKDGK